MKKILSLFLFLFSLVIVGCKKEPSYIEFKTNNIVMEVNTTYKVEYEVFGDVENISFKIENEDIVFFNNDILTSRKVGKTTLTCTYNENEKIDVNIKVIKGGSGKFEVGDPSLNEENYNKLKEDLDVFSNTLDNSNYLTLDLGVQINDQKSEETIRAINDPIYIEVTSNNQTSIIAQEGKKVFEYYIDYYNYVQRNLVGYIDNYENEEINESTDLMIISSFDKEVCNVKYEDDVYTLTCLYEDMLNEESKEMLEDLFKSAYIPVDALYETVVTTQYIFYEDKLYIGMSLVYWYSGMDLDIKITYEFDLKEFTPIDIFNGHYRISNPKNFEEAYKITIEDEEIEIRDDWKAYYIVELEKGMIVSNSKSIRFELYDMNKKLVSSSLGESGNASYVPLDSYMAVPESGTYYLMVENRTTAQDRVNVKFYPYNTVVTKEGIDLSSIDSLEGEIEGKYDFEKLVYNNESTENYSARIENTGDETIAIYHNKEWYEEGISYIEPNGVKYMKLMPGENRLFVCEDFLSSDNADGYKYSFKVDILEFAFDGEVYEEDIPNQINLTQYESKYYYTYLERGQYSIESLDYYHSSHEVKVYDSEGMLLNSNIVNYDDDYELSHYFTINESKYYYVGILNHTSGEEILQFNQYNYETIADKNNPKILDVSGNLNEGHLEGNQDFEYYKLENNTNDIKVYRITSDSEEKLDLYYREYKGGNLLVHNISKDNEQYFASYPGEMNILVTNDYRKNEQKELDYSFKVEEVENNNITSKNSSDIKEITEEYSEDYIMTGYSLPDAYFKLNLKEKGIIRFDYEGYEEGLDFGMQAVIEDKAGNTIYYSDGIEAGEYYVRFTGNNHIFSYAKVKYTYYSLEDKDVYVTLPNLNDENPNVIYSEKLTNDHVIRYHFTLTEKSTVRYNSSNTEIYHEDGTLAVIIPASYWRGGTSYVDLKAGDYYFTTPKMYGSTNSQFRTPIDIGISSKDRDAPQDFENMVELELGKNYSFKEDYYPDCEYLKINIQEKANYYISITEGRGFLYNENLEFIDTVGDIYKTMFELDKGTYYLVIEYTTYAEPNTNVKITQY